MALGPGWFFIFDSKNTYWLAEQPGSFPSLYNMQPGR